MDHLERIQYALQIVKFQCYVSHKGYWNPMFLHGYGWKCAKVEQWCDLLPWTTHISMGGRKHFYSTLYPSIPIEVAKIY